MENHVLRWCCKHRKRVKAPVVNFFQVSPFKCLNGIFYYILFSTIKCDTKKIRLVLSTIKAIFGRKKKQIQHGADLCQAQHSLCLLQTNSEPTSWYCFLSQMLLDPEAWVSLLTKVVNMILEQKLLTRVVNKSCEQNWWTKNMSINREHKFWTEYVN